MQKRYKEIHAPGSILSLEAKDKDGKPYSEDGIERAVYFEDINVDATQTNPEFMQAIASYFRKDSDIYKTYKKILIEEGYSSLYDNVIFGVINDRNSVANNFEIFSKNLN